IRGELDLLQARPTIVFDGSPFTLSAASEINTVTVKNNANNTMGIDGISAINLRGSVVENSGEFVWTGTNTIDLLSSQIVNKANGTFEMTNAGRISQRPASRFLNEGTLVKSGDNMTNIGVPFENKDGGILRINQGATLGFSGRASQSGRSSRTILNGG